MKALVTGGTGFIGSHVVDKLLGLGFEVRCIIRKTSNLRWLEDKPIEMLEASFYDKESLIKAVEGVDYIFHIAGLTFAKGIDEFMKGNKEATQNLLEVIFEYAPNIKRFLFLSSQTVTGPAKTIDKPVDETTICNPMTSYGKSKKAAEDEIMKYMDKIPITIIRAPAVYGPREEAIYAIFKSVKFGLATMVGFKPKYVSLIHSEDLSRGIVESALSENTVGQVYFVSSDEFYTWGRLIPLIAEKMNKKFVVKLKLPHFVVLATAGVSEFFGKFAKHPPVFNYEKGIDFIQDYWICSIEKAKKDFGFRQKVSIEDGIQGTIKWYKEHKWL